MALTGAKTELLCIAVAAGKSLTAAADSVGMPLRSAQRHAAEPGFRERVSELQGETTEAALGQLADGLTDAVATLRVLLNATTDSVRLGAARALLQFGLRRGGDDDDSDDRPASLPADPLAPLHEYFKGITDPLLTQLLDAVAADNARRREAEAEIQARTVTCRIASPSGSEGQADDA